MIQLESIGTSLRTRSFFLLFEEGQKRDIGHFHHLETNTWDITDGVSRSTESGDQDFVVFLDVIQTTVLWYERGDLFAVLDELYPDALSDGRIGLFGLNADLLKHDAFDVRSASERIGLQSCAGVSLLVIFVCPSLHAAMSADFTGRLDSSWFSHH